MAKKKLTPKLSKDELAANYDRFKKYGGKQYTGMKVGKSHKWYYDKGEWHETKITPDLWEINYAVTKRRAGKAPEGSGASVGTGYHWFILSHQNVSKLNADDYTTAMWGFKFKLSHKRADKQKWNASASAQRKNLILFLKRAIKQLQTKALPLKFEYDNIEYVGDAIPVLETCTENGCMHYEITLNNEAIGIIRRLKSGWKMNGVDDLRFVKEISKAIQAQT
jgi:hypothetical protein